MMSKEERLLHQVACEAARQVEEALALPSSQRALRFFEIFRLVKGGLEEFSRRRNEREGPLVPDMN
jgi:hypothetical protein